MIPSSELIFTSDQRIYHLGFKREDLAENVILCGDPDRVTLAAEYLDPGSLGPLIRNREFAGQTGRRRGRPVTVIGTGIGPDNTEIALTELHALWSFDPVTREKIPGQPPLTLIRVGTSGTPRPEVSPGTLAVSACSIGLDNTGMYYDGPAGGLSDRGRRIESLAREIVAQATPEGRRFSGRLWPYVAEPSPEVTAALAKNASEPMIRGITLSAPGFFGPQGRAVEGLPLTIPGLLEHLGALEMDGLGVVNLEMETSVLFHLSAILGFRAGAVCAVIANRATGRFLADYHSSVRRAIQTAYSAIVDLAEE